MDRAALYAAGLRQLREQRPAEAAETFRRLLQIAPEHFEGRVDLGVALLSLGRSAEAEAAFREALVARPAHPMALKNLGVLLMEQSRHADGLALADAVLAREQNHRQALLLRGAALAGAGQVEEAVGAYGRVLAARPDDHEALTQLGLAQAALQQYGAALEALDRAVALRPDDPFARSRRGALRLQLGDFGGWTDYEARLDLRRFLTRSGGIITPAIAGQLTRSAAGAEVLADRRVLLLGEQGIGDQLMFASMIPDVARTAAAVSCVCDPRLVRLFANSFDQVRFDGPLTAQIRRNEIDAVLAMGSLGGMFRTRKADFPGSPYLRPRPAIRDAWAQRLGPASGRLRVGLSWRGGLPSTRRNERSLSLEQLRPLLALPACEFVSLQYGEVEAEVAGSGAPIRAFPPADIDDFEDLAGLVANLDVVVSVQTALVHLAGALGKSCLTLVPHNPEWRYGARGETMPWYGAVRLFRQGEPGAWAPVIDQVAEALRGLSPGSASIGG
ncbi:tetratricopeptide repeat protein [Phenylobacterium sp.]|uniref:tetratricopeptide repeat protein n=1 Tax=Phenylobacterium sp. TaxID=1871053 RepID=UPI0025DBD23E|nr:tetratricopeptide repeat protein [Phenylobacterium sp.]